MKKNLKSVISFVIALGLCASSAGALAATTYTDVPADASYAEAVANLTAIGIVEGDGNGTFRPDDKITRAEVAAMVVRAMAQNDAAISSKGTTNFTDVSADNWASGYINVASRGTGAFINGMGDGTFEPDSNVTYAQIVKMVVAAIGYGDWGVAAGGYPTGYIATAKQLNITDGVSGVNADDEVSRAVVAQLINNAIDTPLLSLKTYSPTNPEYVIMNGKDDNDYETVLTYYHDIYKVEGRVKDTHRSNSSIDADEIRYQIEATNNYDDSSISMLKKNDGITYGPYLMKVGDTDVADYLDVYSKLLVKVTDDEDPVVLSCVASGKNVTTTLQADAWDDEYYSTEDESLNRVFGMDKDGTSLGENKGQLWYYSNSDKTGKSTRYYLSDGFRLYVNGVEVDATQANVKDYIFDNETGTVTLVDTVSETENSTDGKYDSIYVSYFATGIVESVNSNGKVYFDKVANTGSNTTTYVEFDDDDDDLKYSISLDGKDVKYSDLQKGDVISVSYNVVDGFGESNFYDVLVSRNTAEGKVTETNDEDDEIGINGTTYKMIADDLAKVDDFNLGTSYTIYLDAFGKVADFEKLASSVKYGIINRFYYSDDAAEYKFSMYDATATSKTYDVADTMKITIDGTETSYETSKENADLNSVISSLDDKADDTNVQERVVEYTTNSSGEIKTIEFLNKSKSTSSYTAKSNKLGSLKFDDATVMISVDGTDFSVLKTSSLVDDNDYTAYGYDRDNSVYGFIVVTDGVSSFTKDTRFAVVNKVSQGSNEDGDDCDKIQLYSANSKDLQTVYADGTDMFYGKLKKGDVIIYKTNASGLIEDAEDVEVVFSASLNGMTNFTNSTFIDTLNNEFYSSFMDKFDMPSAWEDEENEVELKFGPIIDRSSSSITLGKLSNVRYEKNESATGEEDKYTEYKGTFTYTEDDSVAGVKVEDLDYASDVAVYVYDFNNSSDNRLSVGTVSSVPKTTVSEKLKVNDSTKDATIIDWSNDETPDFAYALVKMVEDDVTDVFVIIPKD